MASTAYIRMMHTPVSYTHLDVYKRQQFFHTTFRIFVFGIFQLYDITAVSYTHLDVYKRQKLLRFFYEIEWQIIIYFVQQ